MMPTVRSLYHYPIKGLSPQSLSCISLQRGLPCPDDRVFALARPGGRVDPAAPAWAKKGHFVNLMLDEELARVRTHVDPGTQRLVIEQAGKSVLSANLDRDGERAEAEQFFHALVPSLSAAPRIVRSDNGHFMDKPDNVLSVINLATLRSLEVAWGYHIDPLRFRANFYVDGIEPWAELDWIGQSIQIGGARFLVDRRNGRCAATNVDPVTGRRDRDIPGALRAAFGHKDLGVYLTVRDGGRVAAGDPVIAPVSPAATSTPRTLHAAQAGPLLMCGGCYFIYVQDRGLPDMGIAPGTDFDLIAADWRCPDCGTDKTAFRMVAAAT